MILVMSFFHQVPDSNFAFPLKTVFGGEVLSSQVEENVRKINGALLSEHVSVQGMVKARIEKVEEGQSMMVFQRRHVGNKVLS